MMLKTVYSHCCWCMFAVRNTEGQLGARFHVTKYPTLKMFRFGSVVKREYRGQRSVSALTNFIRTQLVVPVTRLSTPDDIYSIDVSCIIWFIQLCVSSFMCTLSFVNLTLSIGSSEFVYYQSVHLVFGSHMVRKFAARWSGPWLKVN